MGNIVPHKVTNAINKNKTFCIKKAASLEKKESKELLLFNVPCLSTKITTDKNNVNPMTPRKTQPIVDSAKEWTEGTGPPRFMNIPICAIVNATIIRTMFQLLNMPRLF